MNFEEAHEFWFQQHVKKRKGEAKRRLLEGHGVGEKKFLESVWWPAFGHLEHLTPEYEIVDYKDGHRYMDFAYVRGAVKLNIEVDGYETHCRNLSRRDFIKERDRQNHIVIDKWSVLRFAYDKLVEQPRQCQQTIQQFLGTTVSSLDSLTEATKCSSLEREIIRFMHIQKLDYVTPAIVKVEFDICVDTAYRALKNLVSNGIIEPLDSSKKRIYKYRLVSSK